MPDKLIHHVIIDFERKAFWRSGNCKRSRQYPLNFCPHFTEVGGRGSHSWVNGKEELIRRNEQFHLRYNNTTQNRTPPTQDRWYEGTPTPLVWHIGDKRAHMYYGFVDRSHWRECAGQNWVKKWFSTSRHNHSTFVSKIIGPILKE